MNVLEMYAYVGIAEIVIWLMAVYWFVLRRNIQCFMLEWRGEGYKIRASLKKGLNITEFNYLGGKYLLAEEDALEAKRSRWGTIAYYMFDMKQIQPLTIKKPENMVGVKPLKFEGASNNFPKVLKTYVETHKWRKLFASDNDQMWIYIVLGLVVCIVVMACVFMVLMQRDVQAMKDLAVAAGVVGVVGVVKGMI